MDKVYLVYISTVKCYAVQAKNKQVASQKALNNLSLADPDVCHDSDGDESPEVVAVQEK